MDARPYQVMPPPSRLEYEALKADIAKHGVKEPVDIDEEGNVLDGHTRVQICGELDKPYDTRVVSGLGTDEAKREYAWRVNLLRRQLTRAQKRALAKQLREARKTEREIAQWLGVGQSTVSNWLSQLSKTGELVLPETVQGSDGKDYKTERSPRRATTTEPPAEAPEKSAPATTPEPQEVPSPSERQDDPGPETEPSPVPAPLASAAPEPPPAAQPSTPASPADAPETAGVTRGDPAPTLIAALTRALTSRTLEATVRNWGRKRRQKERERCRRLIEKLQDFDRLLQKPHRRDALPQETNSTGTALTPMPAAGDLLAGGGAPPETAATPPTPGGGAEGQEAGEVEPEIDLWEFES